MHFLLVRVVEFTRLQSVSSRYVQRRMPVRTDFVSRSERRVRAVRFARVVSARLR